MCFLKESCTATTLFAYPKGIFSFASNLILIRVGPELYAARAKGKWLNIFLR